VNHLDERPLAASSPARQQLARLRRLHAATEQLLDAAAVRYGVSRIDMRCLEVLERRGPSTAGELAKATELSPAAITKVLRRLQDAGYAVVETPATDRRQTIARTSDQHDQLRVAVWTPIQQSALAALGRLDDEQHAALAGLLEELASASETHARLIRDGAQARQKALPAAHLR
jgi:DNA-binding MarR family transcriptional regulator